MAEAKAAGDQNPDRSEKDPTIYAGQAWGVESDNVLGGVNCRGAS